MIINTFPKQKKITWVAADTETRTYIRGRLVTDKTIKKLGRKHKTAWFRENAEVVTWAYIISDGQDIFIGETFTEFCEFIAEHKIKSVWWYNAKFDFSGFDYQLLKSGWQAIEGKSLKPYQYNSLHSDFGARYALKLCYPSKLKGRGVDRHERAHQWGMYDFCNIFGGGLARLMQNFNCVDFDGKPIRKLEMDYQSDVVGQKEIDYMRNDAAGLYHCIRLADEFLREQLGYTLTGTKPDIITAGGLAKRVLLEKMYKTGNNKKNVEKFQRAHKVDYNVDRHYREHCLYGGGKTILNPAYKGKFFKGVKLYQYDVNSMYPAQMRKMLDIIGYPTRITLDEYQRTHDHTRHVYIFEVTKMYGALKPNMIPVWNDPVTREFSPVIDYNGTYDHILYFDFELAELRQWYNCEIQIKGILQFDAVKNDGYREFVDFFYEWKNKGKREKNTLMEAFAKLLLNSAYGKLAENPLRGVTHRELNEFDAVSLVSDGEKIDESGILSVIQGALITAMARTDLMKHIRAVCPVPARDFVYCDTDCVHSIVPYNGCDPYTLGALKNEADPPYTTWKYLAPKTYIYGRTVAGKREFNIRSKGIPHKVIAQGLKRGKSWRNEDEINKLFSAGQAFQPLAGLNIKGGKALIPIMKMLVKVTDNPDIGADEKIEEVI